MFAIWLYLKDSIQEEFAEDYNAFLNFVGLPSFDGILNKDLKWVKVSREAVVNFNRQLPSINQEYIKRKLYHEIQC